MRACSWTPQPLHPTELIQRPTWDVKDSNFTLAPTSSCEQAAGEDGSVWHATRVGPMTTHGGWWWSGFLTPQLPGIRTMVNKQPYVWVTATATLVVSTEGDLLKYPPMHNHHSHIYTGGSSWVNASLQLNHQDRVCSDPDDGFKCMLTTFPTSYGILLGPTGLSFEAIYNDVRAAGSPSLKWYVELALRVSARHQRKSFYPTDMWFSHHVWTPNIERFWTFEVPADKISMVWTHVVISISAKVLKLWMHTHESAGHLETWYFDTHPKALGLDVAPYRMPVCAPFVPSVHGLALTDVQQHILAHARTEQERLGPDRRVLRCVARKSAFLDPHSGDRQPDWTCHDGLASRLVAGANLTAVTFFKSGSSSSGTISQHDHFQAYIVQPGPAVVPFTKILDEPVSDGVTTFHPGRWDDFDEKEVANMSIGDGCTHFHAAAPNPPDVVD